MQEKMVEITTELNEIKANLNEYISSSKTGTNEIKAQLQQHIHSSTAKTSEIKEAIDTLNQLVENFKNEQPVPIDLHPVIEKLNQIIEQQNNNNSQSQSQESNNPFSYVKKFL